MTEQQAQTATAVYGQLILARQELNRLLAIRPLLSGMTLTAGPGVAPVRVEGVRAEQLRATADVAEQVLRERIAELEQRLAAL